MKCKSLKVCIINGKVYTVGDEVELNEDDAKRYLEAQFVEHITTEEQKAEVTEETAVKKGK